MSKKQADIGQIAFDLGDVPKQFALNLDRPAPQASVSREQARKGWVVLRRLLGKTLH